MSVAMPDVDERTDERVSERTVAQEDASRPWQTVVWNDPVNLMSYVARVFRRYFGYSPERATELMLDVHHRGHAVVAEGAREPMEAHARAMHDYGLWATVRKAPE